MPSCRAPAASAWPWLPALAATTPLAQESPSAASLAATPRTLNEPVRCRFSALSKTVPPARSLNVRVESTGVRRATPSTAGHAAWTSIAESWLTAPPAERPNPGLGPSRAGCRAASEGDDRVHLDLGPHRERGHADRRAGGRVGREVARVGLVHL